MSGKSTLVCIFVFALQIQQHVAIALPPQEYYSTIASSSPSLAKPSPLGYVNIELLQITTSSITPKSNLDTTHTPAGHLAIEDVSGVYGPGAWSAWFLAIVGSWLRVCHGSSETFDPNTWLFLLGTNWAGIGIFRGIHLLGKIPADSPDYDELLRSHMGSLGAAFNMLFWGTFHAVAQFAATLIIFRISPRVRTHRLRTLTVGLILPSISLLASLGLIPKTDILPALYWEGIGQSAHRYLFVCGALATALAIPAIVSYGYFKDKAWLPGALSDKIAGACDFLAIVEPLSMVALVCTLINTIVWWCFIPISFVWFLPFDIPGVVIYFLSLLILPRFWDLVMKVFVATFISLLGFIIVYVFAAYLCPLVRVSESCFFMPCAPQSIKDDDQMYALVGGLVLLVGCEIIPFILRMRRQKRGAGVYSFSRRGSYERLPYVP